MQGIGAVRQIRHDSRCGAGFPLQGSAAAGFDRRALAGLHGTVSKADRCAGAVLAGQGQECARQLCAVDVLLGDLDLDDLLVGHLNRDLTFLDRVAVDRSQLAVPDREGDVSCLHIAVRCCFLMEHVVAVRQILNVGRGAAGGPLQLGAVGICAECRVLAELDIRGVKRHGDSVAVHVRLVGQTGQLHLCALDLCAELVGLGEHEICERRVVHDNGIGARHALVADLGNLCIVNDECDISCKGVAVRCGLLMQGVRAVRNVLDRGRRLAGDPLCHSITVAGLHLCLFALFDLVERKGDRIALLVGTGQRQGRALQLLLVHARLGDLDSRELLVGHDDRFVLSQFSRADLHELALFDRKLDIGCRVVADRSSVLMERVDTVRQTLDGRRCGTGRPLDCVSRDAARFCIRRKLQLDLAQIHCAVSDRERQLCTLQLFAAEFLLGDDNVLQRSIFHYNSIGVRSNLCVTDPDDLLISDLEGDLRGDVVAIRCRGLFQCVDTVRHVLDLGRCRTGNPRNRCAVIRDRLCAFTELKHGLRCAEAHCGQIDGLAVCLDAAQRERCTCKLAAQHALLREIDRSRPDITEAVCDSDCSVSAAERIALIGIDKLHHRTHAGALDLVFLNIIVPEVSVGIGLVELLKDALPVRSFGDSDLADILDRIQILLRILGGIIAVHDVIRQLDVVLLQLVHIHEVCAAVEELVLIILSVELQHEIRIRTR